LSSYKNLSENRYWTLFPSGEVRQKPPVGPAAGCPLADTATARGIAASCVLTPGCGAGTAGVGAVFSCGPGVRAGNPESTGRKPPH
jgi:hypothetical protein